MHVFCVPGCHQLWAGSVLEAAGEVEGEHLQAGVAEPGGVPPPLLLLVPHVQVPPGQGGKGEQLSS